MPFCLQRQRRIRRRAGHPEGVSAELVEFLAYLENSTEEFLRDGATSNIRLLHEKVKQVKKNAELEAKYMTGEDLLRLRECKGKAEGILVILSSKFDVPEELREKIQCQADASVLDEWLVSAANATSMEDFTSKI